MCSENETPAVTEERRPVSYLDQLEIQELVTRFNRSTDRADIDTWVACFTPDGAFEGIPGRHEGRDALRELALEIHTTDKYDAYKPMRHWTTNYVIDYDCEGSDSAVMRADHMLFRTTSDSIELALLEIYHDRLRRYEGHWLFAERVIEELGGRGA